LTADQCGQARRALQYEIGQMTLSDLLLPQVSEEQRRAGTGVFKAGLVHVLKGTRQFVSAVIRGMQDYPVEIKVRGKGQISVSCTCDLFRSHAGCKHLWAVVLEAEGRRLLTDLWDPEPVETDSALPADIKGDFESDIEDILTRALAGKWSRLAGGRIGRAQPRTPPPPPWKRLIQQIPLDLTPPWVKPWPASRELFFAVDSYGSISRGGLVLNLYCRDQKNDGTWGKFKRPQLVHRQLAQLPEAEREIMAMLAGAREGRYHYGYGEGDSIDEHQVVFWPLSGTLVPLIAQRGRLMLDVGSRYGQEQDLEPVVWDDHGTWQFRLKLHQSKKGWAVTGLLHRGEETMPLSKPALILDGGFVFFDGKVALIEAGQSFPWISALRQHGQIEAGRNQQEDLLTELLNHPLLPALELPEPLAVEEVRADLQRMLRITPPLRIGTSPGKLRGHVSFSYGSATVSENDRRPRVYDRENRRLVIRDLPAEQSALAKVREAGLRLKPGDYTNPEGFWELAPSRMPKAVRDLVADGWQVEAEGKAIRRATGYKMEVASGIDWFELHGSMEYDEAKAELPDLLKAIQRGDNMVPLSDGTFGMIPEEWMHKWGNAVSFGEEGDGHVRFRRTQIGLLDALLAAEPEVDIDERFRQAREELRRFEGVEAAPQPEGFVGELRGYQCEGLGWMNFLQQFGFGGCLADDMGVGKTAQVLALLEAERQRREANADGIPRPSLVVAPRSLIFNWMQEAARFTPNLRVLDHTGLTRSLEGLDQFDIVLTTYGTLRRDAAELKDVSFNYAILDEAQAIKNATTESAKAARLLKARHRLALSGTPIENHLGELWSLIEFLNPGMLGSAKAFQSVALKKTPDEETRRFLGRAIRPFILRRTKQQVAKELPEKLEQTLVCELEFDQRKLYNDLRDHYRQTLLSRVDSQGMAKSKMHVLEALLRLRQAACHPGLIDKKRLADSSAKLDLLLPRLSEVTEEGHKALVFSQFTSMLSIVKAQLDSTGLVYEYLDGQTVNRQARVERFQNDPDCRLFLISLKAGGVGLNLTSAGYVFLLDPWWNPAVETQAIDRTHRIGQTQRVFAYRLIARDTVEEKILQLQESKRDLADSIITADSSVLRNLGREDLELLLS
jgi:hypothetical protein